MVEERIPQSSRQERLPTSFTGAPKTGVRTGAPMPKPPPHKVCWRPRVYLLCAIKARNIGLAYAKYCMLFISPSGVRTGFWLSPTWCICWCVTLELCYPKPCTWSKVAHNNRSSRSFSFSALGVMKRGSEMTVLNLYLSHYHLPGWWCLLCWNWNVTSTGWVRADGKYSRRKGERVGEKEKKWGWQRRLV